MTYNEGTNNPSYRHGLRYHPLYKRWNCMKGRCLNPNDPAYHNYGGRGITICDEWVNDPMEFIEWCLKNGYRKDLELDRRESRKGYSPENCRFINRRDNCLNKGLLSSSNTSGYRGVSWNKGNKSWQSQIQVKGKRLNLGSFGSPGLAALRFDVEAYIVNDKRPMNFIETVGG